MKGLIATFVLGSELVGLSLATQAQSQADQDQNTALQAIAKTTEGQRTYYQKNSEFRAVINNIQKNFGITLPSTFDYAVRTTSEAAYSYVIPVQSTTLTSQELIWRTRLNSFYSVVIFRFKFLLLN